MASTRRSKFEPYKPPAEFGQQAIEITKALGKTPDDLVRAVGYESKKTLERLARGEGSLEFALAIRDQLEKWGADVSLLPALGVESSAPVEQWEREWVQIGKQLHRLANPEKFQEVVDTLRDLIESHEKIAVGTGVFSRRPRAT